jgi:hypothetical protein
MIWISTEKEPIYNKDNRQYWMESVVKVAGFSSRESSILSKKWEVGAVYPENEL